MTYHLQGFGMLSFPALCSSICFSSPRLGKNAASHSHVPHISYLNCTNWNEYGMYCIKLYVFPRIAVLQYHNHLRQFQAQIHACHISPDIREHGWWSLPAFLKVNCGSQRKQWQISLISDLTLETWENNVMEQHSLTWKLFQACSSNWRSISLYFIAAKACTCTK